MHTLKGLQEPGVGFLSPVRWTSLIYSPVGWPLPEHWGEPTGWWPQAPVLHSGQAGRQVRCPVLSFVPSLTILPLYMYSLHPSCAGVCPSPGKELAGPVDCRLQAGTPRIGRGSWLSCSKAPAVPRATGGTHGNTENTRAPLCLLHLTVSQ